MPYQPDQAAVRAIADPYTPDDLAWYAREYADTPWMVHVQGPDDCITHRDEDATVPLAQKDAEDLALAVNTFTVSESENSEYAPHMHATVSHHGVPVEAQAVAE